MSTAWPHALLAALLVACSGVDIGAPIEPIEPSFTEALPEPGYTVQERPEPVPEPEVVVEEEHDVCPQLVEAARGIAAGEEVELPEPYEVVYTSTLDPNLEVRYGWHPWGLAEGTTATIWPELHPAEEAVTFTALHELGHLIEWACLTWEDQQAWLVERGLSRPWITADPYSSPEEDYADSFAVCYGGSAEWWSVEGEPPTPEQCSTLTGLVEGTD